MSNENWREIVQSPIEQGSTESVKYGVDVTNHGGSPASPSVALWLNGVDKSADNLTGSATAAGDVITTPAVHSLVPGRTYRMVVEWSDGTNTLSTWCDIVAKL